MACARCSTLVTNLELKLRGRVALLRSCNECDTRDWYVDEQLVEPGYARELIGASWSSVRRQQAA